MMTFALVSSGLIYLLAARSDLLFRIIPDWMSIALSGLAVLRWAAAPQVSEALWTLGSAALIFAVGLVCFSRGWFGGGDVKLLSASILLVGSERALWFLLMMALMGGVLSVGVLIWDGFVRRSARASVVGAGTSELRDAVLPPPSVPYGIAIAVAAICVEFPQLLQH
jgi:prepilin peptidase CpaA